MAVCDICGKKLGFADPVFGYKNISLCNICNGKKNILITPSGSMAEKIASLEFFQECLTNKKHSNSGKEVIEQLTGGDAGISIDEKKRILTEKQIEADEAIRKKREEEHQIKIEHLRKQGAKGYYEYKVISLLDNAGLFRSNSGRIDVQAMSEILNNLGIEGWHLVTAYSNEAGKNALSGGAGGAIVGVNSTVDENILIFERFVAI